MKKLAVLYIALLTSCFILFYSQAMSAGAASGRASETAETPGQTQTPSPVPVGAISSAALPAPGDPLPGLTDSQLADFNDGKAEFTSVETVADGLGPVFNGHSCSECHSAPASGGGSNRLVTRFGKIEDGLFDPMVYAGGSLIQDHAIGPADGSPYQFSPETVPPTATIIAHRRAQPLFGLGLVDAVDDTYLVALAQKEADMNDGTAGRINMVINVATGLPEAGKFGWKDQVPSLQVFAGDAYLNEMGITNSLFPDENCPDGDCSLLQYNPDPGVNDTSGGVQALTNYMTLLAPVKPAASTGQPQAGARIFEQIGCGSCHVATMKTGDSTIASLDHKTFHPYSDFLLHDIGTGDGIVQGDATGAEIRTAPLWGLRYVTSFLHDGSASSPEQAITAHGGQAGSSRERFDALSAPNKQNLLEFLASL